MYKNARILYVVWSISPFKDCSLQPDTTWDSCSCVCVRWLRGSNMRAASWQKDANAPGRGVLLSLGCLGGKPLDVSRPHPWSSSNLLVSTIE